MRHLLFTAVLFSLVPSAGLANDSFRNLRQEKFFQKRESVAVQDLIEALEKLVVPLSRSDAVVYNINAACMSSRTQNNMSHTHPLLVGF